MKNKLCDLNEHLFEALERLGADDLEGEALAREIQRSKTIASVAAQAVDVARVSLEAMRTAHALDIKPDTLPDHLRLTHQRD